MRSYVSIVGGLGRARLRTSLRLAPDARRWLWNEKKKGERPSGIGRLRPNVVLYGEEHPRGEMIGAMAVQDTGRGPDVVLVVG